MLEVDIGACAPRRKRLTKWYGETLLEQQLMNFRNVARKFDESRFLQSHDQTREPRPRRASVRGMRGAAPQPFDESVFGRQRINREWFAEPRDFNLHRHTVARHDESVGTREQAEIRVVGAAGRPTKQTTLI